MIKLWILFTILLSIICVVKSKNISEKFPDNFLFGIATSAHQIEGAWNTDGKGENIWDHLIHKEPNLVMDGSNADVSCDSYHLYKDDVQLLINLGVDFYRFSISWSRILPTGYSNFINPKGIQYYNDVIDELLFYNITPVVTMHHFDLPQVLQDLGGWTNFILADRFLEYARVLFDHYGDRVKHWVTINELLHTCQYSYGGFLAPMINSSGLGDYLCTRTILLAHAKVYHLYDKQYRLSQKGKIGLTTQSLWYESATNRSEDKEAAERALLFNFALFTDPIFSETGDFPEIVKQHVSKKSKEQGFSTSRLPQLSTEEIKLIKGTADFLGLNYYSARLITDANGTNPFPKPSFFDDVDTIESIDPTWIPSSSQYLYHTPDGLRKMINWLSNRYDKPEIWILENGIPDSGDMNDTFRVDFLRSHLDQVLSTIYDDGCNVTLYTAWSLMDNFEWLMGYEQRLGFHAVDFKSKNKTRTPKASAIVYKEIIKSRVIDWNFDPKVSNVNSGSTNLKNYYYVFLICLLINVIQRI